MQTNQMLWRCILGAAARRGARRRPLIAIRTRPITRATLRACRAHQTSRSGTTRTKAAVGECRLHSPTMIEQRIRAGGRGCAVQAQPVPNLEGLHASDLIRWNGPVVACGSYLFKKPASMVPRFHPGAASSAIGTHEWRDAEAGAACPRLVAPTLRTSPAPCGAARDFTATSQPSPGEPLQATRQCTMR